MILHSGIGTYIRSTLKILTQNEDLDFTLFGDIPKIANYPAKKVLANFPIYSVREQVFFPLLLSRNPVNMLHVPHYNAPLGFKGNLAVTVHDLIHLRYPPSGLAYLYARGMFQAVLKKARVVMADSEHTKRDILELIGIPEKKIRVIYPGVDEDFTPGPAIGEPPYILYAGNLKPTKNVGILLDAFRLARAKIPELRLVLIGKNFMPDAAKEYSREPGIHLEGEVSRPKLIDFYRNARIFVFPSLYEGFGLPPLEAMACGAPVVCSNAASLPEVVGQAAATFDPGNVGELSEILVELWNDDKSRGDLSKKGLERAKQFTWKKCADGIQKVYAETA